MLRPSSRNTSSCPSISLKSLLVLLIAMSLIVIMRTVAVVVIIIGVAATVVISVR